jgi:hypothetical protein
MMTKLEVTLKKASAMVAAATSEHLAALLPLTEEGGHCRQIGLWATGEEFGHLRNGAGLEGQPGHQAAVAEAVGHLAPSQLPHRLRQRQLGHRRRRPSGLLGDGSLNHGRQDALLVSEAAKDADLVDAGAFCKLARGSGLVATLGEELGSRVQDPAGCWRRHLSLLNASTC